MAIILLLLSRLDENLTVIQEQFAEHDGRGEEEQHKREGPLVEMQSPPEPFAGIDEAKPPRVGPVNVNVDAQIRLRLAISY